MSLINRLAIRNYTLAGTLAQLAMVVIGHYNAFVRLYLFAIVGTVISLVAGALCGRSAATRGAGAIGGLVAGGFCAFIGIAVSAWLSDVPAQILVFGTSASAIAGLVGGFAAQLFRGRRARNASV